MNSVALTVERDLCCGCGVCAGACPRGAIEIKFDAAGQYAPRVGGRCNSCGLCLKVCPFSEESPAGESVSGLLFKDISGMKHRRETGYWLDAYCGFSAEYRGGSASGGLLSYTLGELFQRGLIDRAICVVPDPGPGRLFSFSVLRAPGELAGAAGSVYYPVELSAMIAVMKGGGNFAVTGLPCAVRALRNCASQLPELKKNIRFCLGLVCGQGKNKYFTEYLAAKAGIRGALSSVKFRRKEPSRPASDFAFEFAGPSGQTARMFWTEGIGKVFSFRAFTLRACSFCDDVFAECADAAFMDAWLPAYIRDPAGTSLVISRSTAISGILGASPSVKVVAVEDAIRSQAGVLRYKQEGLACRLSAAAGRGEPVIVKRAAGNGPGPLLRLQSFAREYARTKSREAGIRFGADALRSPEALKALDRSVRRAVWPAEIAELAARPVRKIARFLRLCL